MSIVLDYFGNPCPQRAGPAVASVVTRTCWLCKGDGYFETSMQEFTNVGRGQRCTNCGGTGRVTQEVAP